MSQSFHAKHKRGYSYHLPFEVGGTEVLLHVAYNMQGAEADSIHGPGCDAASIDHVCEISIEVEEYGKKVEKTYPAPEWINEIVGRDEWIDEQLVEYASAKDEIEREIRW